jgi:hypothetical protein
MLVFTSKIIESFRTSDRMCLLASSEADHQGFTEFITTSISLTIGQSWFVAKANLFVCVVPAIE